MKRNLIFATLFLVSCIMIGCEYDVPITAKPTRSVDKSLLGNWTSKDGKSTLTINQWDDANYAVCNDGTLCRVYHSDVENTAFVTVQILDREKPRYAYWAWNMTLDGVLHLRLVNDKLVPDDTKDSDTVQKLLKENLQNPALLGEDSPYIKAAK